MSSPNYTLQYCPHSVARCDEYEKPIPFVRSSVVKKPAHFSGYEESHVPFTVHTGKNLKEIWIEKAWLERECGLSQRRITLYSDEDNLTALIKIARIRSLLGADPIQTTEELAHRLQPVIQAGITARISRKYFSIPCSVDVVDRNIFFGKRRSIFSSGSYSKIKLAVRPNGEEVVRRVAKKLDPSPQQLAILEILRNTTGIIKTYGVTQYTKNLGQMSYVSFHPRYQTDFLNILKNRQLFIELLPIFNKMVHQLLIGATAMALYGIHRDLKPNNLLFRMTPQGPEAVINDFDLFHFHHKRFRAKEVKPLWSTDPPERKDRYDIPTEKWDVWQLGIIFARFYLADSESPSSLFNWFDQDAPPLPHQYENVERTVNYLPDSHLKTFLKGMLAFDPNTRWTFYEALSYFEEHLMPRA